MKFITIAIGLGSLLLSGCASIVSGHNQSLSVVTRNGNDDVTGARCSLTNDKGQWFATTPASVTVRRSYAAMAVDCKTDQSAGVASVKSNTKPMAFGNILFGGVIGVGVDVATGAAYDYPEVIAVSLTPLGGNDPAPVPPEPIAPAAPAAPVPAAATASPSPAGRSAPAAGGSPTVPLAASKKPSIRGGQDSYSVRKVAQASQCHEMPAPVLVAKSPGIELYSVACKSGDLLAVQCEFGACKTLKEAPLAARD